MDSAFIVNLVATPLSRIPLENMVTYFNEEMDMKRLYHHIKHYTWAFIEAPSRRAPDQFEVLKDYRKLPEVEEKLDQLAAFTNPNARYPQVVIIRNLWVFAVIFPYLNQYVNFVVHDCEIIINCEMKAM